MTEKATLRDIQEMYPFTHRPGESEESRWFRAEVDADILKAWEEGRLTGKTARNRLSANNGWNIPIGLSDFKTYANSLGYFRGLVPPNRATGKYGDTDQHVEED